MNGASRGGRYLPLVAGGRPHNWSMPVKTGSWGAATENLSDAIPQRYGDVGMTTHVRFTALGWMSSSYLLP